MMTKHGVPDRWPGSITFSTTHQDYQWVVGHSLRELRELLKQRMIEYGATDERQVSYHRDIVLMGANVQLYACLTIEAVLNFWGVFRLGTDRFDPKEHRSLEKKLRWLARTVVPLELADDHEARVALRRLVDVRNELVHAKPFIAGPEDEVPPPDEPPKLSDAEEAAADMHRVLTFIAQSDAQMATFLL